MIAKENAVAREGCKGGCLFRCDEVGAHPVPDHEDDMFGFSFFFRLGGYGAGTAKGEDNEQKPAHGGGNLHCRSSISSDAS